MRVARMRLSLCSLVSLVAQDWLCPVNTFLLNICSSNLLWLHCNLHFIVSHNREERGNTQGCPLISTCMQWHLYTHTHAHRHTYNFVLRIYFFYLCMCLCEDMTHLIFKGHFDREAIQRVKAHSRALVGTLQRVTETKWDTLKRWYGLFQGELPLS